jgi:hypothetical protein
MSLAGCGDDDDGGGSPGIDLPGIEEATTGRPTITGSNISVTGTGMLLPLAPQTGYNGETFSITGGKFSFTLPASPTNSQALASNNALKWALFGSSTDNDYTASPDDATFVIVRDFRWNVEDTNYTISREAYETDDDETYEISSQIVYIYTDKNVTLSRAAKDWTESHGDETYNTQWGPVNLALKTGWNLVQIDSRMTGNENNFIEKVTVKIADKNVPWTFYMHESSGA